VRIYDNGSNSVNGGASLSLSLSLSLSKRVNESRPSNCSDVYRYYSGTWWFTTHDKSSTERGQIAVYTSRIYIAHSRQSTKLHTKIEYHESATIDSFTKTLLKLW